MFIYQIYTESTELKDEPVHFKMLIIYNNNNNNNNYNNNTRKILTGETALQGDSSFLDGFL